MGGPGGSQDSNAVPRGTDSPPTRRTAKLQPIRHGDASRKGGPPPKPAQVMAFGFKRRPRDLPRFQGDLVAHPVLPAPRPGS